MRSISIGWWLFALAMVLVSVASSAQVGILVSFGPPALPVYEQPYCPAEGYLWMPGYWAYDYDDYYWVPGTWVEAPEVGFLWTPGYWVWRDQGFFFNEGYWAPDVGFYGGINYGFGYFGEGYEGGRWENGRFFYNRSVNNVSVTNIHNVYNTTVINNTTTVNRVSYNGGNGGINARPRPQDEIAARERHLPPVAVQTQHVQAARANPQLRAFANQGRPPVAATPKPGAFNDRAALPAKEAGEPYHPPANRAAARPRANAPVPRPENSVPRPPTPVHAKDLPPHPRPAPVNRGNPKVDQKYQQQQEKLYAKQEKDHQKLQQKQEQDHQRLAQQHADQARRQQVEQKHQQQTQQMEQRHIQQQQKLQNKQPPASRDQPRPPQKGS
jgi:WXXGXW repeat (2 copies)